MTSAEVIGGPCSAVIWMPPVDQEQSQVIAETLLRGSLNIESTSRAVIGEARDTGDTYVCFRAVPGQEASAVDAIKALVERDLPDTGLEVLGPFSTD